MQSDGRLEELAHSLAFDPLDWTSFEGVVALLTAGQRWQDLDRAYGAMIELVYASSGPTMDGRDKDEAARSLWHRLAELRRERLQDVDLERAALIELVALGTPTLEAVARLAELYHLRGEIDAAVDTWEALRDHPDPTQSRARHMLELYERGLDSDGMWCAANVLATFGLLDAEKQLFHDSREARCAGPATPLDEVGWRSLIHGEATPRITTLFRILTPHAAGGVAPVDASVMAYACDVFGVPRQPTVVPLAASTSMAWELGGTSVRQQLFLAGREAIYRRLARPKAPRVMLTEYREALRRSLVEPRLTRHTAEEIARLEDWARASFDLDTRRQLASDLTSLTLPELERWALAVHATAHRAGLLLAGDLRVLERISPPVDHSVAQDLVAFASSRRYTRLRRAAGRSVVAATRVQDDPRAALRSDDPDVVGRALVALRDGDGADPSLVPQLEALLADDRHAAGETMEPLFALAAEVLAEIGNAAAVAALLAARASALRVEVPAMAYDYGAPIGVYTNRVVRCADSVETALHRVVAAQLERLFALPATFTLGTLADTLGTTLSPTSAGLVQLRSGEMTVAVRYPWPAWLAPPELEGLRSVWNHELTFRCRIGARYALDTLRSRGDARQIDGWHIFDNWLLTSERDDELTLCRHATLPEWATEPVDAAGRRRWLELFGRLVTLAKDGGSLVFPDVPRGCGLVRRAESLLPGLPEIRFTPPIPAPELAAALGWEAVVAEAYDEHAHSWNLRSIESAGRALQTSSPKLGAWKATAVLTAPPTGGPMDNDVSGHVHRISARDRVSKLRIWLDDAPPRDPPGEGAALGCRLMAHPHDEHAREAFVRWLAEQGRLRDAYAAEITALLAMLDVGASYDDLAAAATRLASLVTALDGDTAAILSAGWRRFGGALAFAPARLEVAAEPVETARRWRFEDPVPLRILVIGDFLGRAAVSPVGQRMITEVSRDSFFATMREQKLTFTTPLAGEPFTVALGSPADFEEQALQRQLAATGAAHAEVATALAALLAHEPYRAVERAWRSLWWLLQQLGADTRIAILPSTKDDLVEDFDESRTLAEAGLTRQLNGRDHQGMRPFGLVVFDFALDVATEDDARLAAQLAEIGRDAAAPMLAAAVDSGPARPSYEAWRRSEDACFLALCFPAFEIHRSSQGVLHAHGSWLAAGVAARAFARHRMCSPLFGSVGPLVLAGAMDVEEARARGILTFAETPAGATLASDATCRRHPDSVATSLAYAAVVSRACHLILDIDLRAGPERDTVRWLERTNARLAARTAGVDGMRIQVEDVEPIGSDRLRATLVAKLPSPVHRDGVVCRSIVSLRVEPH